MQFNVKDESLHRFFGIEEKDSMRSASPYNLLRDEIVIPKKPELEGQSVIVFDLTDESRISGKKLSSQYVYEITEYDSLSVKLTLKSHKIENV